MKDPLVEAVIQTDPVQEKLSSVIREWSRRTDSGKPQMGDEGTRLLKQVMREHDMDPRLVEEDGLLTEVSFFDGNKYFDEPFIARPASSPDDKNSQFMDAVVADDTIPEPDGLLTRAEPPENDDEAYEVDMTTSDSEPSVTYVEDVSKTVYKLIYTSKGVIKTNFLTSSYNPNRVNWGASEFETAACASLVMNESPQAKIDRLESARGEEDMKEVANVRDEIVSTIQTSGYDWDESGVNEIVGKFQEDVVVHDISRFLSIADGTYTFWEQELQSEGFNNPNFVHGKIREYYRLEQENSAIETEGGKDNTADFLITNVDATTFLDALRDQSGEGEEADYLSVDFDEDTGVCYVPDADKDIRFVQVSHKESFGGGSQLGKFVSDFRRVFGLGDKDVLDQVVVPAMKMLEESGRIDESMFGMDSLSNAFDRMKDAGKTVINKIKDGVSFVVRKLKDAFQEIYDSLVPALTSAKSVVQDTSELENKVDNITQRILSNGIVNENKINRKVAKQFLTEDDVSREDLNHKKRMEIWKQAWKNMKPQTRLEVFGPLYGSMQNNINYINSQIKNEDAYLYPDQVKNFRPYNPQEVTKNQINRMFATYQALNGVREMIDQGEENIRSAKESMKDFANLQKQMVFGRTLLPMWKVGSDQYKDLGTGEKLEGKEKKFIEGLDEENVDIVIISVKGKPGTGKGEKPDFVEIDTAAWATTTVYIIDNYNEQTGESTYTRIEFRSEGHKFSFTVSGKKSGIPKSNLV